jgi:alpha-galactosidase
MPRIVRPVFLASYLLWLLSTPLLAAEVRRVDVGELTLEMGEGAGPFAIATRVTALGPELDELTLTLTSSEPSVPEPLSIRWSIPSNDIAGYWSTRALLDKSIDPDWWPSKVVSMFARDAPVIALFGHDDGNRLTFAASDALNTLSLATAVREEDGRIYNRIELFTERHPAVTEYELVVRLDRRPVPFHQAVRDVAAWWASRPGYEPAPVPEIARQPMYSTWYSYHQSLVPKEILADLEVAKQLGFEAVIVDDGWQTLDSNRGYAYTGDWRPERIPRMKEFVDDVHELGMKFVLWYAMPFIGEKSSLYPKFEGKYLRYWDGQGAWELDPRYPEVRKHIVGTYTQAVDEWGVDGFKLDFIGRFVAREDTVLEEGEGRDFASVNAAADALLTDVMKLTSARNAEVLVEFRQPYIGPLMRKYGNMFRAGDAPNAALVNRVRTIDLRLTSGDTAVHSDMIMWHPEEPVEQAALQLLNVLFSVPQVSVRFERIPELHREMIAFYLGYWRAHRDVLLDGELAPLDPTANYPVVVAHDGSKQIVGLYGDSVVPLASERGLETIHVINAKSSRRVAVDLSVALGDYRFRILDCLGRERSTGERTLEAGLHGFEIPPSGMLQLQRKLP